MYNDNKQIHTMKKKILLCVAIAAMCFSANAQDTLITIQGKAYLSIVNKIEKGLVFYTRFPQVEGEGEMSLDVHALREIRFYDGRHINFVEETNADNPGVNIVIDQVRMKPPSYYLKQSAYCQYGAIATSFVAGFSGALGVIVNATPNSDPSGTYILYGGSIVFGIAAIVFEFSSISNLKKAGKSLERIHIIQNGISFDL